MATNLSDASLQLFIELCEDAPNWGFTPLVVVNTQTRGNLTDLKVKGYITTFEDRGDPFAEFTDAGVELAASLGYDVVA